MGKLIIISFGVLVHLCFQSYSQTPIARSHIAVSLEGNELTAAALTILQNKCNVCHKQRNPRKVFTRKNMEDLAPKIYKQVIVKKRMPRGKDNQLTAEEYTQLEKWLTYQLFNQP